MILTPAILAQLDMPDYLGQRSATFKFVLTNAVVPTAPITLHPLKDTIPTLSHDTARTIKRQITGLSIGTAESDLINAISSRILVYMTIGGQDFPLGRYMFADKASVQYTSGTIINASLYDEMFMVDQEIEVGFAAVQPSLTFDPLSTNNLGMNCELAVRRLLTDVNVTLDIAPTQYTSIGSWTGGTTRGQIIEQLSLDGDWFSPWFDNSGVMRFIRTFDPGGVIPDLDLDAGNRVIRNTIVQSDDLITAPNRFVVISNGIGDDGSATLPIVGRADVPLTAPHSITNRGFVIPSVTERQVASVLQAGVIAQNLALRQTVFERVELATPPDPRHDSYNVILWQNEKWLELAWTLPLIEGAAMGHVMRKAYQ